MATRAYEIFPGGKGFNQSIALARAGAKVSHVGCVGSDAAEQLKLLELEGIDHHHVVVASGPSGHAVIQVTPSGDNAILIHGGANQCLTAEAIDAALAHSKPEDFLLVQNETSNVAHAIRSACERGLSVVFNPAPMTEEVRRYPLEMVDLLILNHGEACQLCGGEGDADRVIRLLREICPNAALVLTLGGNGAWFADKQTRSYQAAFPAKVVDTTAAGDTFIGFFLANWILAREPKQSLSLGCRAAAECVSRAGAATSIPHLRSCEG